MKKYGWVFVAILAIGVFGLLNGHFSSPMQSFPQPPSASWIVVNPIPEKFVVYNEIFFVEIKVQTEPENVINVVWNEGNTTVQLENFGDGIWRSQHSPIDKAGQVDFTCDIEWLTLGESWSSWYEVVVGVRTEWTLNGFSLGTNNTLRSENPLLTVSMSKLEGLPDIYYIVGVNISQNTGQYLSSHTLIRKGDGQWSKEIQINAEGEYMLTLFVIKNYTDPIGLPPSLDSTIRTYYIYGHPEIRESLTPLFLIMVAVGFTGTIYSLFFSEKKAEPKLA